MNKGQAGQQAPYQMCSSAAYSTRCGLALNRRTPRQKFAGALSTTLSSRKRWPLANWSWTKSNDRRALARASTGIGARVPTALRRAFRLRTVNPSSRQCRKANAEIVCDFPSCASAGQRQPNCFTPKFRRRSFPMGHRTPPGSSVGALHFSRASPFLAPPALLAQCKTPSFVSCMLAIPGRLAFSGALNMSRISKKCKQVDR